MVISHSTVPIAIVVISHSTVPIAIVVISHSTVPIAIVVISHSTVPIAIVVISHSTVPIAIVVISHSTVPIAIVVISVCVTFLQIFSDEISEAPPSRPGFESDAEQSAQTLSIPFPEVTNLSNPFPATIIQDYAHLDMEKYAASAHVTGMSARVNNIVRAFRIHGPLDKELLSKALNEVASLHHLLTATFQRSKDRLYMQTSQGKPYVSTYTLQQCQCLTL